MSTKQEILLRLEQIRDSDNFLNILISLKCYLINAPESYYYIFKNQITDQQELNEKQSLSFFQIKQQNEKNLSSLGVKSTEMILMPKNKKLFILEIVDSLINDIIMDDILIFDLARLNPFINDILFEFIRNSGHFDANTKDIYKKRNKDREKLLSFVQYESEYYESCLNLSRYNKALMFWKNSWGCLEKYKETSNIDYLII